jgi:starch-binding outer membrane protein, SusD/RagB family
MKINKTIQVCTAAVCILLSSCLSDLDLQPIDPDVTTSKTIYDSPEAYKQGLAKIYATFILTGQQGPAGNSDITTSDEGNSSFLRQMWNMEELTTDEAVWTYPNDFGGTIFNLHYHSWLPTDGIGGFAYARIMNTVTLANEYMRATAGNSDPDILRYHNEARFLRALAYYYGINLFGKMAFVTEANLPGAFLPQEILRPDLFEFIESELLAIRDNLGAPRFEYGRADQAACAMLLAKLYLNAEVYLGTGNAMYTEAIAELNKVIAGPYTLAPKYLNNFLADNNTSPELIFSFNSDGKYSQSYSAVWTMIKGNAGAGGWQGLRTTKAFVNLFDSNDPRAHFLKEDEGQQLEIDAVNNPAHGYGVYKFRNETSTGGIPDDGTDFIDTDYPLFRLADAYLMYAEAVVRGGTGGDINTAVGYINQLRNRSGDPAIGNITSNDLNDLDFILDERARELYWEGHRRTDLIRFGKFTGGAYLWPWKGNVKEGTSTPSFRNLFPIPAADRALNTNLGQNDGYAGGN